MKTVKIYDRNHNVLDEILNYDNLVYGWTLNDIDTCDFDIGLEDNKCNDQNMQFFNHLEIVDENNNIIWGGQIAGRVFNGPSLHVNCLDYLSLLKWRRLRAKTYSLQRYGSLYSSMINDANTISPTGVSIGNIDTNALQTTRIVQNTDMLLDKIKEFANDVNYDYDVNVNRSFNFYGRKGTDKPQYQLEYGGDADNILENPTLSQDILNMANSAYAEIQNNGVITLSSLAQDTYSQSLYGFVEGVCGADGSITQQSTLDNLVNGSLQRISYPINAFTIRAKDSTLCPFNDIFVGDAVTVSLPLYFGFKALLRIIRMVHDEATGERDITFGQVIYRPQPPARRYYKK